MLLSEGMLRPIISQVFAMMFSDPKHLEKANQFTKNGELVVELITDFTSTDNDEEKAKKAKSWFERFYGFGQQAANALTEKELLNFHNRITTLFEGLIQPFKGKKSDTLVFSIVPKKKKLYLQIAELKPLKKGAFAYKPLTTVDLKKALVTAVTAVRQSNELDAAWTQTLGELFPQLATIQINQ